ncbi:thiolase family protein [Peredibacter starrii]|uniref:Thiolase family protein n=1 Tax=Peredibacter starrii TaxID=28202 RepID=A0AAX4HR78_9BACT|nr:thiolase family protein [Peredibacter starrii]WPU65613.1 thiolase family protein [Peredibacter starrii]
MMGNHPGKVFIVQGKRTPFGKFGGSLSNVTPVELAVIATMALLEETKLSPESLDQVIFANVIPSTPDTLYAGRHLGLKSGMKVESPGIVINRLCGSGIQSLIDASRLIRTQEANAVLVAGAENMSMVPHLTYGARFGTKYGGLGSKDLLLDTLYDKHANMPMGQTAENLAHEYTVTKEESDAYAFESHQKANQAYAAGLIQPELAPVKFDRVDCSKDEHLREDVLLGEMQKLKPTFKKDGTVTAGSASGIVDGACAMIVASEEYVKKHNLKPIAEIIAGEVVGVDPSKMGIGPVPAIQNLLKKQNLKITDIDLFEINEAFAPQVIACRKALEISPDKLNIWGGAVALGHPLGATGLKITLTLARQLQHLHKNYGISSACIGGGQGIALLIKRI